MNTLKSPAKVIVVARDRKDIVAKDPRDIIAVRYPRPMAAVRYLRDMVPITAALFMWKATTREIMLVIGKEAGSDQ